jgi:hypothetical protein
MRSQQPDPLRPQDRMGQIDRILDGEALQIFDNKETQSVIFKMSSSISIICVTKSSMHASCFYTEVSRDGDIISHQFFGLSEIGIGAEGFPDEVLQSYRYAVPCFIEEHSGMIDSIRLKFREICESVGGVPPSVVNSTLKAMLSGSRAMDIFTPNKKSGPLFFALALTDEQLSQIEDLFSKSTELNLQENLIVPLIDGIDLEIEYDKCDKIFAASIYTKSAWYSLHQLRLTVVDETESFQEIEASLLGSDLLGKDLDLDSFKGNPSSFVSMIEWHNIEPKRTYRLYLSVKSNH